MPKKQTDKIGIILEDLMTVRFDVKDLCYTLKRGQITVAIMGTCLPVAFFRKNSKYLATKGLVNQDILNWLDERKVPNITKPEKRNKPPYILYD